MKKLEDLLQQYLHSSSSDNTPKTSRFKFGRKKDLSPAALQPVSCPPPLSPQDRGKEDSAIEETKKEQQSPGTTRILEHLSFPSSSSSSANLTSSTSSHSQLKQCIIDLRVPKNAQQQHLEHRQNAYPTIPALYLDKISECLVIAPDIAGSVLIHDAKDCVIIVSCHQVRSIIYSLDLVSYLSST